MAHFEVELIWKSSRAFLSSRIADSGKSLRKKSWLYLIPKLQATCATEEFSFIPFIVLYYAYTKFTGYFPVFLSPGSYAPYTDGLGIIGIEHNHFPSLLDGAERNFFRTATSRC